MTALALFTIFFLVFFICIYKFSDNLNKHFGVSFLLLLLLCSFPPFSVSLSYLGVKCEGSSNNNDG